MEELFELRACIEQQRYADALVLIGEMEEMGKDDKIHKIYSYGVILLLHLIKKHAEQRSTRSWEFSIHQAAKAINLINRRRKSGGYYLTGDELLESLTEAYQTALKRATLEVFEGQYDEGQISEKVNKEKIIEEALQLVQTG